MPVPKEIQYLIDKHGLQGRDFVDSKPGFTVSAKQPVDNSFWGNVGRSVGSIPGAIAGGIGNILGNTSFAKLPQIGQSIARTGFSMGPINFKGSVGQTLDKRSVMMKKVGDDFKAGKITAKQYSERLKQVLKDTSVDEDLKKSKDALKDASRYGEQFVNNVTVLGAVAGGVAGAAGRTGTSAAAKAAISEAYGGGLKAFGKGVLAETTGLAKPFIGEAGKGGVIKGITGALGGALEGQANAAMVRDFSKGKVDPLNTALTVGMAMPGGPLGAAGAAIKGTGKLFNKAIYDSHGLYDVVKLKGGITVNEALEQLAKDSPKLYEKYVKNAKVGQDLAAQEWGNVPTAMAKGIELNQPSGKMFKDMTLDEFMKTLTSNLIDRSKGQTVLKKAVDAGFTLPEGRGAVMARITPDAKKDLIKRLTSGDAKAEMAKIAKEGIDVEGQKLKNTNLIGQLQDIVDSGKTGDDLAKAIRKQFTATKAVLVDGKPFVTKDGRFLALAKNPGVVKKPAEVADLVKGKKAPLGVIGRTLEKIGLSTKAADIGEQKAIFKVVKSNFEKAVNEDDSIGVNGRIILSRLNKLTDKKTGVFDIRQLSKKEIADALGIDKAEAARIMSHYNDAFKQLSFSERGLAGKLTDWNMRNNPLAPGYARIQSAARYERSPFFRLQENIETALGSSLQNGKLPVMPRTTKYNKTVKVLEDSGFFERELAGPAGEGAAGLGAISAKLSPFQKSTFARDIESLAGKGKENVLGFINNPKNADLIQEMKTIAQYPDKGLTSSNFMKALNLAVFPTRYNLKVTQFAVKQLAKQSGATQMAVIKGLKDFSDWQKTPAGIKWNSDNSEALGILRYFTPVGSIESTLRLLSPGSVKSIRDVGTIGGLPFGVISQILQGQGMVKSDTPYLDPKTGEVVPNKIPKDLKARANQALVDIIGTMFTYPGRQVGIDSKRKLTQGVVDNATMGLLKGGKYESQTRTDLTPEQRRIQAVLRSGSGGPSKYNLPSAKSLNVTPLTKPTFKFGQADYSTPRFASTKAAKGKKPKTRAIPVGQFRP